jgi:hypothetical protein
MKWTEAFKVVIAMVASVGGSSAIILILSSWLGLPVQGRASRLGTPYPTTKASCSCQVLPRMV